MRCFCPWDRTAGRLYRERSVCDGWVGSLEERQKQKKLLGRLSALFLTCVTMNAWVRTAVGFLAVRFSWSEEGMVRSVTTGRVEDFSRPWLSVGSRLCRGSAAVKAWPWSRDGDARVHRAVLLHVAIGGWLVAASERALLLVGPPPVRSNLPTVWAGWNPSRQWNRRSCFLMHVCSIGVDCRGRG